MTLSYLDTKKLIQLVLERPTKTAWQALNRALKVMNSSEPEFYAGVIEHGMGLPFSSEQWFDFHSKIPDRLLRDHVELMNKLSPSQRKALGL